MKSASLALCFAACCYLGCAPVEQVTRTSEPINEPKGVVVIIDVSHEKQPSVIGSISLPGEPTQHNNIVTRDGRLLATSNYGVHIFDLSLPQVPERIVDLPLSGAWCVIPVGQYALITSNVGFYAALDVDQPTQLLSINCPDTDIPRTPIKAYSVINDALYFMNQAWHVQALKVLNAPSRRLEVEFTPELVETLWRFPVFVRHGEEHWIPLLDQLPLSQGISPENLPGDLHAQLANRHELLNLPIPGASKAEIEEYVCFWVSQPMDGLNYSKNWSALLGKRLWVIPPESNGIHSFDIPIEYTKYLYLSGKKKLPEAKGTDVAEVTLVQLKYRAQHSQLTFVSRDNWSHSVEVDFHVIGQITDFKLCGETLYVLTEDGKFLVVKLSVHGQFETGPNLHGLYRQDPSQIISALELPYSPQSMTFDKGYVYLLCTTQAPKRVSP